MPRRGHSISGLILLVMLGLQLLALAAALLSSSDVKNGANQILEIGRQHPGPPHMHAMRTTKERIVLDKSERRFAIVLRSITMLTTLGGLCYFVWVYRRHADLRALGAVNLQFTSAWAVGYHFVPVWNLIRPYQIMREIWHGSDPVAPSPPDCGPRRVQSSWSIRIWWALAIAGAVIGVYCLFALSSAAATGPPKNVWRAAEATLQRAATMQIILTANVSSCLALLGLVWSIERRQAARAARLSQPSA